MCARLSNVPQQFRNRSEVPAGSVVSFTELEQQFESVSHEERGRLSQKVIAVLPKQERFKLTDWISTKTKARPIPNGFVELLTFYAMCEAALRHTGGSITALVDMILEKKSAAGIILPA